jgi:hypothetical protein
MEERMDLEGFAGFLKSRGFDEQAATSAVALAEEYESRLRATAEAPCQASVERFAAILIEENRNTFDAFVTLIYYGLFSGATEVFETAMLMLDGEDIPEKLKAALGPVDGEKAFAGLTIPPLGSAAEDKAEFMRTLLNRLEETVEPQKAKAALSSGLHADPSHPPSEEFAENRKRYLEMGDFDAFMAEERRLHLEYLLGLKESGRPYFTQPITQQVVDFVRDTPTGAHGRREGDKVRITKIPYMADRYLNESDPSMKPYWYCHCPWARESLKPGRTPVSAKLCECSSAFVRRYWEGVFDQPVQIEIVKTLLNGDDVCEFLVQLPEGVLEPS